MHLQDLYQNIHNQRDQLQAHRHQQASQFTASARQLIDQATAEQFSDKELLKTALEMLMHAVQHNRQHTEAYLCLAYLMYLIGDDTTALEYLKDALALEPAHPVGLELKAEILKQRFAEPTTKTQAHPSRLMQEQLAQDELAEEELDEDELQQAIVQAIHQLSSQPPPQVKGLDLEAYQQARQFQALLQQRQQVFEAQLLRLEQEVDVMSLRQALRPLEVFLRRSQQQLQGVQQLLTLQRDIQREIRVVQQMYDLLAGQLQAADLKLLEQKLEQSLDQADLLADQLDALENQGIDQQALVQLYEQLVTLTQQFIEQLDEKTPAKGAPNP